MNRRILCVDDEPRVLQGLEKILGWDYELTRCTEAAVALAKLGTARAADAPFGMVISDMRMPGMDGAEFLSRVRRDFPETTRVLLTGFTDIESAMKAVNDGAIFRLLLKPCPPETLEQTAADALEQYRLVTAERELLDQTLQGAIEALVETLSLASPIAFSRATKIRDYVRFMSRDVAESWLFETAALFAHMGLVAVPNDVIERFVTQQNLQAQERTMIQESGALAAGLVAHVPRLEGVAAILRGLQSAPADAEPEVLRGIAMVRLAIDADLMELRGTPLVHALKPLSKRHDPDLVRLLDGFHATKGEECVRSVGLEQLNVSMSFAADVMLETGQLLVKKGQRVTPALLSRMKNFDRSAGVCQPLLVTVG